MRRLPLIASAAALLALAAAAVGSLQRQAKAARYRALAPPPAPAGCEAPVAARLDSLRSRVLADPLSASAWGNLGMSLHIHQFQDAGIASYRRALELGWAVFPGAYYLAMALQTVGREQEALEAYARCRASRPGYAPLWAREGQVLAALGRADQARAAFSAALERDPTLYQARVGLAQAAMDQGDWPAARAELERALRAAPGAREAHALMAGLLSRLDQAEAAREQVDLLASLPSASPIPDSLTDSLVSLGASSFWMDQRAQKFLARGQLAEAEAEMRACLRINPTRTTYAKLAQLLADRGRFPETEALLLRGLERFPGPELWNSLGAVTVIKGDEQQAAAYFRRSLETDSGFLQAFYNLGNVYGKLGMARDAILLYRNGLRRYPGDVVMARSLAWNLVSAPDPRDRDAAQAVEWARSACASSHNRDPYSLETLAVAQAAAGRYAEAMRAGEQGLALARSAGDSTLIDAFTERLAGFRALISQSRRGGARP